MSLIDRLSFRAFLLAHVSIKNLYFQPPESKKLSYPCIIYSMDQVQLQHADNVPYMSHPRYSLILIDKDPDSKHVNELLTLPGVRFDRSYASDNLNHWAFSVYYN